MGISLENTIKVTIKSDLFGEKNLKFNFENKGIGIYGANITIGKDIPEENYVIAIRGEKSFGFDEQRISVRLDPKIYINVSSLQKSYENDDRIILQGTAKYFDGAPAINQSAELRISAADFYTIKKFKTDDNGFFNESFLISFAEPQGRWSLMVNVFDKYDNEGDLQFKTDVQIPAGVAYYKVSFFSPLEHSEFKRGSSIPITVQITDEGNLVTKAIVSAKSPFNEELALREVKPGIYSTEYYISINDPLGDWQIPVQAIFTENNITKAGGMRLPITIRSAEIKGVLTSPRGDDFFSGQKIKFKAELNYPDNSPVKSAEVAVVLGNKSIQLNEKETGVYSANYLLTKADLGATSISLQINDAFGNSITTQPRAIGVREISKAGLYLRLFYYNFIVRFWYIYIVLIILVVIVTKPLWLSKYLNYRLEQILNSGKRTTEMLKDTQRKYFKEHLINKNQYEQIILKYTEKASDLKEKNNKINEGLNNLKQKNNLVVHLFHKLRRKI